jgi:hypothetical protein
MTDDSPKARHPPHAQRCRSTQNVAQSAPATRAGALPTLPVSRTGRFAPRAGVRAAAATGAAAGCDLDSTLNIATAAFRLSA